MDIVSRLKERVQFAKSCKSELVCISKKLAEEIIKELEEKNGKN